jgi:hypothetical protein
MLAEKPIKLATDQHVLRVAALDDLSQGSDELSLESDLG